MINAFEINFSDDVKINAIQRISKSIFDGQVGTGENANILEGNISSLLGVNYVSAVNSGSGGLEIALKYLKQKTKIEKPNVLVPTNTFMATVEACRRSGFEVILVDINPNTYGMDYKEAEELINESTVGIVPVHIGGMIPEGFEKFCAEMKYRGIFVIEDSAHSFGAFPALTGDVAVSSFFATKVITGGEGGAVWTNDKEIHDYVRRQRNFGKPEKWVTYHKNTGWNYRIQEFSAILVDEQVKEYYLLLAERRRIALAYISILGDRIVGYDLPMERQTFYKVMYKTKKYADDIVTILQDEIGFPGGVYDIPIHKQPAYEGVFKDNFPKANEALLHQLCLPIYYEFSLKDAKIVANKLRGIDNG